MIQSITPKQIAGVSIIIALLGLAVQVMALLVNRFEFDLVAIMQISPYLNCVNSIQLSLLSIGPPEISPVLTILFQLMVITGAIQVLSGKQTRRLLITGYLLIFIQNVLYIPILLYAMLSSELEVELSLTIRIVGLFTFSIWSYLALKILITTREFKKIKYGEGDQTFYQPEEVSKGLRFLNYLADFFLLLMVLGNIYQVVLRLISYSDDGSVYLYTGPSGLAVSTVSFIIQLLYYLLTEAVFKLTPGKALTGTFVVDASGNQATTKQLIGRSFARLIPFDAFSFLSGIGWHDSASGTTVVKQGNSPESPFITPDADGVIRYSG